MRARDLGRRFESVARILSIGGRRLAGIDTNPVPPEWQHITKIDPETEKAIPLAFPLYLSHTSAVSVGGSRGVTAKNTEETFTFLGTVPVPAFHEPSGSRQVTKETSSEMEFLAIPEVLNGDSKALIGTLGDGLDYVREELGAEMIQEKIGISLGGGALEDRAVDAVAAYLMHDAVFEAYIIMNADSAAAREANVTEDDLLSPEEARKRALAAEYHLESEVVYLEYSGTFGGEEAVELLAEIDDAVSWGRIWYGGGLDNRENVETILDAGADAVVVGDIFHDIAESERRLIEKAREAFEEPADNETIQSWVAETVSIEETAATRYLSTIPDVDNPAANATAYLATAVAFALAVDALAAELSKPTATTLERTLRNWPEATAETGTENRDAELDEELARRLALSLLAERFDVEATDALPARHLAVEI